MNALQAEQAQTFQALIQQHQTAMNAFQAQQARERRLHYSQKLVELIEKCQRNYPGMIAFDSTFCLNKTQNALNLEMRLYDKKQAPKRQALQQQQTLEALTQQLDAEKANMQREHNLQTAALNDKLTRERQEHLTNERHRLTKACENGQLSGIINSPMTAQFCQTLIQTHLDAAMKTYDTQQDQQRQNLQRQHDIKLTQAERLIT